MITNKIKKNRQQDKAVKPFQSDQEIGLFTFYREQHNQKNVHVPSEEVFTPKAKKVRQIFAKKNSERIGSTVEELEKSIETFKKEATVNQDYQKIIIKKRSKKSQNAAHNVLQMSFEQYSSRKNAIKTGNLARYKTEPKHPKALPEQFLYSINLTPQKKATSEQVKTLFAPKRQLLNKIICSSVSSQKNPQHNHSRPKEHSQQSQPLAEYLSYRPREPNFLHFLYDQKNMLSEQFMKRKKNKRFTDLLNLKFKQKQLKKYRINNKPILGLLSASNKPKYLSQVQK